MRRDAVERSGRLVGEHETGMIGERARDRDSLALAAREIGREIVRSVGEPDVAEQGDCTLSALATWHVRGGHRQLDVLTHGERRQQVMQLKNEPDRVATELRRLGQLADADLIDEDSPARGTVQAADQLQERRLARAGRAGQCHHLAGLDGEAHVVQNLAVGEAARRVLDGHASAGYGYGRPPVARGAKRGLGSTS